MIDTLIEWCDWIGSGLLLIGIGYISMFLLSALAYSLICTL
jgi:hypothetical protein